MASTVVESENGGSDGGIVLCMGCGQPGSVLKCPTCLKLGLKDAFFCSQTCFKDSWKAHKKLHDPIATTNGAVEGPLTFRGFTFTGDLRPWPQSERRTVPASITRPDYADHPKGRPISEEEARGEPPHILTDDEKKAMRKVCRLAREVLDAGCATVGVGVTCDEIDRVVHEASVKRKCYPSPLNYYTFPKSCCTSVNEVICHGIPDKRPLQDGDIVNIDVTVYHDGFHGDLNETLFVGTPSDEAIKLVATAYASLDAAIDMVRPGTKFRDLGGAIQKAAQKGGCSVVKSYTGHGIHRLFHTAPTVPHHAGNKAVGVMKANQVFTIEPMINAGKWRDISWPDDWTAVTEDGKWSAQFEQTMTVTENGVEVLTARPNGGPRGRPWFKDQLKALGLEHKLP